LFCENLISGTNGSGQAGRVFEREKAEEWVLSNVSLCIGSQLGSSKLFKPSNTSFLSIEQCTRVDRAVDCGEEGIVDLAYVYTVNGW